MDNFSLKRKSFTVEIAPNDPKNIKAFSTSVRKSCKKLKKSKTVTFIKSCLSKLNILKNLRKNHETVIAASTSSTISNRRVALKNSIFTLNNEHINYDTIRYDEVESRSLTENYEKSDLKLSIKSNRIKTCTNDDSDRHEETFYHKYISNTCETFYDREYQIYPVNVEFNGQNKSSECTNKQTECLEQRQMTREERSMSQRPSVILLSTKDVKVHGRNNNLISNRKRSKTINLDVSKSLLPKQLGDIPEHISLTRSSIHKERGKKTHRIKATAAKGTMKKSCKFQESFLTYVEVESLGEKIDTSGNKRLNYMTGSFLDIKNDSSKENESVSSKNVHSTSSKQTSCSSDKISSEGTTVTNGNNYEQCNSSVRKITDNIILKGFTESIVERYPRSISNSSTRSNKIMEDSSRYDSTTKTVSVNTSFVNVSERIDKAEKKISAHLLTENSTLTINVNRELDTIKTLLFPNLTIAKSAKSVIGALEMILDDTNEHDVVSSGQILEKVEIKKKLSDKNVNTSKTCVSCPFNEVTDKCTITDLTVGVSSEELLTKIHEPSLITPSFNSSSSNRTLLKEEEEERYSYKYVPIEQIIDDDDDVTKMEMNERICKTNETVLETRESRDIFKRHRMDRKKSKQSFDVYTQSLTESKINLRNKTKNDSSESILVRKKDVNESTENFTEHLSSKLNQQSEERFPKFIGYSIYDPSKCFINDNNNNTKIPTTAKQYNVQESNSNNENARHLKVSDRSIPKRQMDDTRPNEQTRKILEKNEREAYRKNVKNCKELQDRKLNHKFNLNTYFEQRHTDEELNEDYKSYDDDLHNLDTFEFNDRTCFDEEESFNEFPEDDISNSPLFIIREQPEVINVDKIKLKNKLVELVEVETMTDFPNRSESFSEKEMVTERISLSNSFTQTENKRREHIKKLVKTYPLFVNIDKQEPSTTSIEDGNKAKPPIQRHPIRRSIQSCTTSKHDTKKRASVANSYSPVRNNFKNVETNSDITETKRLNSTTKQRNKLNPSSTVKRQKQLDQTETATKSKTLRNNLPNEYVKSSKLEDQQQITKIDREKSLTSKIPILSNIQESISKIVPDVKSNKITYNPYKESIVIHLEHNTIDLNDVIINERKRPDNQTNDREDDNSFELRRKTNSLNLIDLNCDDNKLCDDDDLSIGGSISDGMVVKELFKNQCMRNKFYKRPNVVVNRLDSIEECDEIIVTENDEFLKLDSYDDDLNKDDLIGRSSLFNCSGYGMVETSKINNVSSQITIARNAQRVREDYTSTRCRFEEERTNIQHFLLRLIYKITTTFLPRNLTKITTTNYVQLDLGISEINRIINETDDTRTIRRQFANYLKSILTSKALTIVVIFNWKTCRISIRVLNDINNKVYYDSLIKRPNFVSSLDFSNNNSPIYQNTVSLNKKDDDDDDGKMVKKQKKKYNVKILPSKVRPLSSEINDLTILNRSVIESDDGPSTSRTTDDVKPVFKSIDKITVKLESDDEEDIAVTEAVPSEDFIEDIETTETSSLDLLPVYAKKPLPDFAFDGLPHKFVILLKRLRVEDDESIAISKLSSNLIQYSPAVGELKSLLKYVPPMLTRIEPFLLRNLELVICTCNIPTVDDDKNDESIMIEYEDAGVKFEEDVDDVIRVPYRTDTSAIDDRKMDEKPSTSNEETIALKPSTSSEETIALRKQIKRDPSKLINFIQKIIDDASRIATRKLTSQMKSSTSSAACSCLNRKCSCPDVSPTSRRAREVICGLENEFYFPLFKQRGCGYVKKGCAKVLPFLKKWKLKIINNVHGNALLSCEFVSKNIFKRCNCFEVPSTCSINFVGRRFSHGEISSDSITTCRNTKCEYNRRRKMFDINNPPPTPTSMNDDDQYDRENEINSILQSVQTIIRNGNPSRGSDITMQEVEINAVKMNDEPIDSKEDMSVSRTKDVDDNEDVNRNAPKKVKRDEETSQKKSESLRDKKKTDGNVFQQYHVLIDAIYPQDLSRSKWSPFYGTSYSEEEYQRKRVLFIQKSYVTLLQFQLALESIRNTYVNDNVFNQYKSSDLRVLEDIDKSEENVLIVNETFDDYDRWFYEENVNGLLYSCIEYAIESVYINERNDERVVNLPAQIVTLSSESNRVSTNKENSKRRKKQNRTSRKNKKREEKENNDKDCDKRNRENGDNEESITYGKLKLDLLNVCLYVPSDDDDDCQNGKESELIGADSYVRTSKIYSDVPSRCKKKGDRLYMTQNVKRYLTFGKETTRIASVKQLYKSDMKEETPSDPVITTNYFTTGYMNYLPCLCSTTDSLTGPKPYLLEEMGRPSANEIEIVQCERTCKDALCSSTLLNKTQSKGVQDSRVCNCIDECPTSNGFCTSCVKPLCPNKVCECIVSCPNPARPDTNVKCLTKCTSSKCSEKRLVKCSCKHRCRKHLKQITNTEDTEYSSEHSSNDKLPYVKSRKQSTGDDKEDPTDLKLPTFKPNQKETLANYYLGQDDPKGYNLTIKIKSLTKPTITKEDDKNSIQIHFKVSSMETVDETNKIKTKPQTERNVKETTSNEIEPTPLIPIMSRCSSQTISHQYEPTERNDSKRATGRDRVTNQFSKLLTIAPSKEGVEIRRHVQERPIPVPSDLPEILLSNCKMIKKQIRTEIIESTQFYLHHSLSEKGIVNVINIPPEIDDKLTTIDVPRDARKLNRDRIDYKTPNDVTSMKDDEKPVKEMTRPLNTSLTLIPRMEPNNLETFNDSRNDMPLDNNYEPFRRTIQKTDDNDTIDSTGRNRATHGNEDVVQTKDSRYEPDGQVKPTKRGKKLEYDESETLLAEETVNSPNSTPLNKTEDGNKGELRDTVPVPLTLNANEVNTTDKLTKKENLDDGDEKDVFYTPQSKQHRSPIDSQFPTANTTASTPEDTTQFYTPTNKPPRLNSSADTTHFLTPANDRTQFKSPDDTIQFNTPINKPPCCLATDTTPFSTPTNKTQLNSSADTTPLSTPANNTTQFMSADDTTKFHTPTTSTTKLNIPDDTTRFYTPTNKPPCCSPTDATPFSTPTNKTQLKSSSDKTQFSAPTQFKSPDNTTQFYTPTTKASPYPSTDKTQFHTPSAVITKLNSPDDTTPRNKPPCCSQADTTQFSTPPAKTIRYDPSSNIANRSNTTAGTVADFETASIRSMASRVPESTTTPHVPVSSKSQMSSCCQTPKIPSCCQSTSYTEVKPSSPLIGDNLRSSTPSRYQSTSTSEFHVVDYNLTPYDSLFVKETHTTYPACTLDCKKLKEMLMTTCKCEKIQQTSRTNVQQLCANSYYVRNKRDTQKLNHSYSDPVSIDANFTDYMQKQTVKCWRSTCCIPRTTTVSVSKTQPEELLIEEKNCDHIIVDMPNSKELSEYSVLLDIQDYVNYHKKKCVKCGRRTAKCCKRKAKDIYNYYYDYYYNNNNNNENLTVDKVDGDEPILKMKPDENTEILVKSDKIKEKNIDLVVSNDDNKKKSKRDGPCTKITTDSSCTKIYGRNNKKEKNVKVNKKPYVVKVLCTKKKTDVKVSKHKSDDLSGKGCRREEEIVVVKGCQKECVNN